MNSTFDVCPIGQFNFVQSLISPLEIKERDSVVCASCETKDCIRGRDDIPGCELHGVLPVLLVGAAAALCRRFGQLKVATLEAATRFSYALVPLGFSMWLAHYGFHFLASSGAAISALQRFAGDLGLDIVGEPAWARACCQPVADWIPRLEIRDWR